MIPLITALEPSVDVSPNPRLHRAAQEFESMLLSEMLKMGSEEQTAEGELDAIQGGFDDLRNQAVATALAKNGGIGIARLLESQVGAEERIGTGHRRTGQLARS
jgi:Rod binding domain-containing protein